MRSQLFSENQLKKHKREKGKLKVIYKKIKYEEEEEQQTKTVNDP